MNNLDGVSEEVGIVYLDKEDDTAVDAEDFSFAVVDFPVLVLAIVNARQS